MSMPGDGTSTACSAKLGRQTARARLGKASVTVNYTFSHWPVSGDTWRPEMARVALDEAALPGTWCSAPPGPFPPRSPKPPGQGPLVEPSSDASGMFIVPNAEVAAAFDS